MAAIRCWRPDAGGTGGHEHREARAAGRRTGRKVGAVFDLEIEFGGGPTG